MCCVPALFVVCGKFTKFISFKLKTISQLIMGRAKSRPDNWITVRMRYNLAMNSPAGSERGNAAVRFRGRHRKTTFGENGKEKADVHGDSEHRIVTSQSQSAALRSADFSGHSALKPWKTNEEMIILNRKSNEKVRIRVRLTEEEKKLEQNSALCAIIMIWQLMLWHQS